MRHACLVVLSLLACTSTQPTKREDPAPVAETPQPTPPTPPTPATPPTPPTPTTPPTPPTPPTTGEPSTPWWCTCYARKTATGSEPVTACRGKEDECYELERSIASGKSPDIVVASVTHACREIQAAHPGDTLATRDAWKPSKKPGAWLSTGACHIPGPANPEDAQPPDEIEIDEQIGEFDTGIPDAQVIAKLGEPTKKGRIELEGATGDYIQSWTYQDGLSFSMAADKRKGPQKIVSVTITAPSQLKTKKGFGIGSTRADVIKHYGKVRAPESEPDDEESFIAGSIYGGLFFTFNKQGKVTEIFLGAGAE